MRVLFIQHDHVSPPGVVGSAFEAHGYVIDEHVVVPQERFYSPGVEPRFPDLDGVDAVVAMGAPWSAYDDELVGSWVAPELKLLRDAHAREIPVLGICFGGQMLALAHGGVVAASPRPEIGWHEVQSEDETLVPSGPWFQWHSDRWEMPSGARQVAHNAAASQAFVLGRNLAVQFHPELDSEMLAGWLANGGDVQLAERGIDVDEIVAQTLSREASNRGRARQLVDGLLSRLTSDS